MNLKILPGAARPFPSPAVEEKLPLLRAVQTPEYWKEAGVLTLEHLRGEMRPLIRFLDRDKKKPVFTDFEDAPDGQTVEHQLFSYQVNDLDAYRKRVRQFLDQHRHHLAIHKLTHNIPITSGELSELEDMLQEQADLGSREAFRQAFGEQPLGVLVRTLLGLNAEAARAVFAEFLATPGLNTTQIRFIDLIVRSLTVNGVIEPRQLFEPPFTDLHTGGLTAFDDRLAVKVVDLLEGVRRNAGVA